MKDLLYKARLLLQNDQLEESINILHYVSAQLHGYIDICPGCAEKVSVLQKNGQELSDCPNCGAVWGRKVTDHLLVKYQHNQFQEDSNMSHPTKQEILSSLEDLYRCADPDVTAYDINYFVATGQMKKSLALKLGLSVIDTDVEVEEKLSKAEEHISQVINALEEEDETLQKAKGDRVQIGARPSGRPIHQSAQIHAHLKSGEGPHGIGHPMEDTTASHELSLHGDNTQHTHRMKENSYTTLARKLVNGKEFDNHRAHKFLTGVSKEHAKSYAKEHGGHHSAFDSEDHDINAHGMLHELHDRVKGGEFNHLKTKKTLSAEHKGDIKKNRWEEAGFGDPMTKDEVLDAMLEMFKNSEDPQTINRHSIARFEVANEIDEEVLKLVYRKVGKDLYAINKVTPEEGLEKISSEAQKWISAKVSKLREEGKPQEQAIAIAHSMAREKGYSIPKIKKNQDKPKKYPKYADEDKGGNNPAATTQPTELPSTKKPSEHLGPSKRLGMRKQKGSRPPPKVERIIEGKANRDIWPGNPKPKVKKAKEDSDFWDDEKEHAHHRRGPLKPVIYKDKKLKVKIRKRIKKTEIR